MRIESRYNARIADSLNVSAAGAIMLYEAFRQRYLSEAGGRKNILTGRRPARNDPGIPPVSHGLLF